MQTALDVAVAKQRSAYSAFRRRASSTSWRTSSMLCTHCWPELQPLRLCKEYSSGTASIHWMQEQLDCQHKAFFPTDVFLWCLYKTPPLTRHNVLQRNITFVMRQNIIFINFLAVWKEVLFSSLNIVKKSFRCRLYIRSSVTTKVSSRVIIGKRLYSLPVVNVI